MMSVKYRPHRGSLDKAMSEVVSGIENKAGLVEAMKLRCGLLSYFPLEDRPTVENVTVEPYGRDERIGWDTHIVCVNGQAWGFTDGPLPS